MNLLFDIKPRNFSAVVCGWLRLHAPLSIPNAQFLPPYAAGQTAGKGLCWLHIMTFVVSLQESLFDLPRHIKSNSCCSMDFIRFTSQCFAYVGYNCERHWCGGKKSFQRVTLK